MPIYEYKCSKCGNTVEVIQKVSDPPVSECVKCSGAMTKVISPAGLMFKGTGWYITDYSSKGKQSEGQSKPKKNQEEKVSDKKEEKTTETTTATPAKAESTT